MPLDKMGFKSKYGRNTFLSQYIYQLMPEPLIVAYSTDDHQKVIDVE